MPSHQCPVCGITKWTDQGIIQHLRCHVGSTESFLSLPSGVEERTQRELVGLVTTRRENHSPGVTVNHISSQRGSVVLNEQHMGSVVAFSAKINGTESSYIRAYLPPNSQPPRAWIDRLFRRNPSSTHTEAAQQPAGPVLAGSSRIALNSSTPVTSLSRMSSELSDQDEECVICMGLFREREVVITQCSHKFHKACLEKWLDECRTCPNCRQEIEEA